MIYFMIYMLIGIIPLFIWKSMFDIDHNDIEDQIILGVMWIAWPFTVLVIALAQIGKIPGKLIDWYKSWQELMRENWEKLEKDEDDLLREKE